MNKIITAALLATLPFGASILGCVGQDVDAREDKAAQGEETVESTILRVDDAGHQTMEVTTMTRGEQQQILAARKRHAAQDSEGLGEAAQALTVGSSSDCYARGLLVFSNTFSTGSMLSLCVVGHEGGGTATFNLPPNWIKTNGGLFPWSFYPGDESGLFWSQSTSEAFAPWSYVGNASAAVQFATSINLTRLLAAPTTDPALTVPAGQVLVHKMAARGHQIYTCQQNAGVFAWTFIAPSALLFDTHTPFDLLGEHYIGPSWRSADDGSTVTGVLQSKVASPVAGAIPWLILQASGHTGTGLFSNVSYIQRVNTTGGVAPATACDLAHRNQSAFVDYTADYYFYASPALPASWTCPSSWYNGTDGCDCACGAPDPDCVKPDQWLYRCASGQTCSAGGVCQ
jgi:hypothetical protein